MKRSRFAVVAALMALALAAPVALAAPPPGTLDQNVTQGEVTYLADWQLSQTFTAGLTGNLTGVELYCQSDVGLDATVELAVGGVIATGTCSGAVADWIGITLPSPVAVTAGTQYTILFHAPTPTRWYLAGAAYSGGVGGDGSGPIADDFAFRTYVLLAASPPPTTTSPASEPAHSDEPPVWLLPAALASLVAVAVVLRRRGALGH